MSIFLTFLENSSSSFASAYLHTYQHFLRYGWKYLEDFDENHRRAQTVVWSQRTTSEQRYRCTLLMHTLQSSTAPQPVWGEGWQHGKFLPVVIERPVSVSDRLLKRWVHFARNVTVTSFPPHSTTSDEEPCQNSTWLQSVRSSRTSPRHPTPSSFSSSSPTLEQRASDSVSTSWHPRKSLVNTQRPI